MPLLKKVTGLMDAKCAFVNQKERKTKNVKKRKNKSKLSWMPYLNA
tara:strand:+ start:611 stop:748 length:138 start_codon:yes stop_codon:yes gene_type:complete